jgi:GNAT superfamily N-acetyltransferase
MTGITAITIRRIRPSDAATLKRVRLAALLDTPSAFGSTHAAEADRPDHEWELRARLGAEGVDRVTFFAVDARTGDVVGIVGGYRDDPSSTDVDVVSMWTAPSARRRGVARLLVHAVLDWARATGATSVSLWVTRGNDAAEALYRAMGFVPTGDHQPLPSDPCKDELRMTRGLEPLR